MIKTFVKLAVMIALLIPAHLNARPLLLDEPADTHLVEFSTDALPLWRQHSKQEPTLVILSNDPFLMPIPAPLKKDALTLAKTGSPKEVERSGRYFRAAPLLLPSQAVRAAIESGFFKSIVWIAPSTREDQALDSASFKQNLAGSKMLSPEELTTVSEKDGYLQSKISDTDIVYTSMAALPTIQSPVVLHIDLSYFRPLYKNEIKTPIYGQIENTFRSLQRNKIETPATATISFSTGEEAMVPLELRFLGYHLRDILRKPEILEAAMPELWQLRSKAYYLNNLFQKDAARKNVEAMAKLSPDEPSVQFDLYSTLRSYQEVDIAFEHLHKAVTLDPGYAYEYIRLSETAMEKNRPDGAIRMLDLAIKQFPLDPYLKLQRAETAIAMGHGHAASRDLKELAELSWSPVYSAKMPDFIKKLKDEAKKTGKKK